MFRKYNMTSPMVSTLTVNFLDVSEVGWSWVQRKITKLKIKIDNRPKTQLSLVLVQNMITQSNSFITFYQLMAKRTSIIS